MISRVSGKLLAVDEDQVTLQVSEGVAYDLLVPKFMIRRLMGKLNEQVEFHTYHYLEGGIGGGTTIPRLVGFPSIEEREFFEKFITVPNVGVRKALRSFVISTTEIASAIEMSDFRTLERLPGVGKRSAQKIVAELKEKVGKYALIKQPPETEIPATPGLTEEVTDVLLQLGYNPREAVDMIEKVIKDNPDVDSSEKLLQAIYKQRSEVV